MKIPIRKSKRSAEPVSVPVRHRWLSRSARCDACHTARAYVSVIIHGTVLHFCAHHYRQHEEALLLAGASDIRDDREHLHS